MKKSDDFIPLKELMEELYAPRCVYAAHLQNYQTFIEFFTEYMVYVLTKFLLIHDSQQVAMTTKRICKSFCVSKFY